MAATADTVSLVYKEPEYAQIASLGSDVEYFPPSWGLGKEIQIHFEGILASHHGDISAWTGRNAFSELEEKEKELEAKIKNEQLQSSIKERISFLKRLGPEEDITPSNESGKLLIEFLVRRAIGKKPLIFLLENGNFRALWKNKEGEQIGLQFLPNGNIQFVIFSQRPDSQNLARYYGADTPQGINRHVEMNRLRKLLYG